MSTNPRNSSWKRHLLYTLASAGVTVGVFSYLLATISIREVYDLIRNVDRHSLGAFVVLSLLATIMRTWRYSIILTLSGHHAPPFPLFLVVVVRNLFSDLLPARIGSAIYIVLVTTRLGIPIKPALSSFALPFFFDLLALAPMILLAAIWAGAAAKTAWPVFAVGGLGLALIAALSINYLPRLIAWAAAWMRNLKLPNATHHMRLSQALQDLALEFAAVNSQAVYMRIFILSVLVRLGKYASLYIFLYGLLKPLNYSFTDLPIPTVFLGICAAEFAASLPVSGLAAFGAYEGTWAVVFSLLGYPDQIAKLTSIAHHLFTQLYGYCLGLGALLLLMLPFWSCKNATTHPVREEPWMGFMLKLSGLLLTGSLCLLTLYLLPLQARSVAPPLETVRPSAEQQAARRELYQTFPVTLIFDSNASGTFAIYAMRINGSRKRVLIDSPLHDIFPDVSPDGKRIVFARTASTSLTAPSEIWIADIDGSAQRRLSSNGTFPTFSSDGQTVYFERERKKVMALNLQSSVVTKIFSNKDFSFGDYEVAKPRMSPDGKRLAFLSDRGGRWNVFVADLKQGTIHHIGRGCQPVWFSDSRRLAWVGTQKALDGSGIFFRDLDGDTSGVLHDAPAPFGHEYFPMLAHHDRYLLFAASPSAQHHDHTAANYQLFAVDLNSHIRIRITFDSATNRWPKVIPNYSGK